MDGHGSPIRSYLYTRQLLVGLGVGALVAIAIWIPTRGRNQQSALPSEYRVTASPMEIAEDAAPTKPERTEQDETRSKDARDLRKRVFALQAKLMQAQQASPIGGLENPNFEISKAGDDQVSPVAGWQIPKDSADQFEVVSNSRLELSSTSEDNQPDYYLTISNATDEAIWIRSNQLQAPGTGRLSVAVWLRSNIEITAEKTAEAPRLRVALDAKNDDQGFYRFAEVAEVINRPLVDASTEKPSAIGPKWKRFAIHFDDLPTEISELSIGFDLMNVSQVDVARVQIYDRWFDQEEAQAITQLLASVDALLQHPDKVVQCRQLLNDDWAIFLDKHFQLKPLARSARLRIPMFQRQTERQR